MVVMSLPSRSRCREERYSLPVPAALRPRGVPTRPLAGLAGLLGCRPPDGDAEQNPFSARNEPRGVTGITHDSTSVRPGDLYAALPGSRHHGAAFCAQAAAAGAVAAVLSSPVFFFPRPLPGVLGSSASVRLLFGHTRKLPDLRFFSRRYELPHSGQGSATGL